MHLGTLLSRIQDEQNIPELLASAGDILLLERVAGTAEAYGETPVEYIQGAVQRYAAQASSDDWLQLMTAMEKEGEPGKTALSHMVAWAMRADSSAPVSSCGCHGHESH